MEQKVTLVWIYMGQNPTQRLDAIGKIDGTHLDILAVGNAQVQRAAELYAVSSAHSSLRSLDSVSLGAIWNAVSPESRAVVFWMDDGKPVNSIFPLDMARPLACADANQKTGSGQTVCDRHLHYWDGNALAISRSVAESISIEDMSLRDNSLLTLLSDIVDRDTLRGNRNLKLLFSPLERFAAIEATPVGLAS